MPPQKKSKYQVALEKLPKLQDDLKKSFLGKANDKQLLGNHAIAPVLNGWGEALSLDINNAKYWFREGNSKLPEEIEMHNMAYEVFSKLFELWLEHEDKNTPENQKMYWDEDGHPVDEQGNPILPEDHDDDEIGAHALAESKHIHRANSKFSPSDSIENPPQLYNRNVEKFSKYWNEKQATIESIFFKWKNPISNFKIIVAKIFPFFQELTASNIIRIKESAADEIGFFQNENNKQKMLDIIENFIYLDKQEEGSINVNRAQLSLDELPFLFDFWFKNDPNVIVILHNPHKKRVKELEMSKKMKAPPPTNYAQNKKQLEEFFTKNSSRIRTQFLKNLYYNQNSIPIKEFEYFVKNSLSQLGFRVTYTATQKNLENLSQSIEEKNSLYDTIHFFMSSRREDQRAILSSLASVNKEIPHDFRINIQECLELLDNWARLDGNLSYSYTAVKTENIFQSNSGIKQSLKDSLLQYTAMLEKAHNEFEKRVITETMNTLKTQLWNIEHPDQFQETRLQETKFHYFPQETQQKREERRDKGISEIFQHYCRQQSAHDNSAMSFSTFMTVVNDFNLIRSEEEKNIIPEIYRKCVKNDKYLRLEDFTKALQRLADIFFVMEEKLQTHTDRIEAFYKHIGLYNGKYRLKLMEFYKNNDISTNGESGLQTSFSLLKENQSLLYDVQKPNNRHGGDFRRGLFRGIHLTPKKSVPDLHFRGQYLLDVRESLEIKKLGEDKKSFDASEDNPFANGRRVSPQNAGFKQMFTFSTNDSSNGKNGEFRSQIMVRANQIDDSRKKKELLLANRISHSQDMKNQRTILKYAHK